MVNIFEVYFKPYKKQVMLIIAMAIIQVILQILIIIMVRPIISSGINNIDVDTIFNYSLAMVIMIILYSVITVLIARYAARISADSVSKIREDMFAKILSFKRPRDSGANMSGLMNRLVTDVNNVQGFITEFLSVGLYVPLLAVGVIIVTAIYDWLLCITLTLAFIVMVLVIIHLGRREVQVRSKLQRMLDRMIQLFRDMIIGARASRAYDTEKTQFETFSELDRDYSNMTTDATIKVGKISSLSTFVLMGVIILLYPLMLINFGDLFVSSTELIVFVQFLVLFVGCASITPFMVTTLPLVKASFGRISKVMNGQSEQPGESIPDEYDGPLLSCSNGLTIERGFHTLSAQARRCRTWNDQLQGEGHNRIGSPRTEEVHRICRKPRHGIQGFRSQQHNHRP